MCDVNPRRKRLRLASFDYSTAGAYFVTICTHERRPLFRDARIRSIVESRWASLRDHHAGVRLDAFVVMPNHVHAVLWLGQAGDPTPLPVVVRSFKSSVTKEVHATLGIESVWQRSYHERVVRTPASLERTRRYVIENPERWNEDPYNAACKDPGAEAMFWHEIEKLERIVIASAPPPAPRPGRAGSAPTMLVGWFPCRWLLLVIFAR